MINVSSSIISVLMVSACLTQAEASPSRLIDPQANEKTHALYNNLTIVGKEKVLFGHQNSLAYGYSWINESGRSDVKDVAGSYPALYGWDLADLFSDRLPKDRFTFGKDDLLRWVREAYARGGVSTFSWHQSNPRTGKNFYDRTPAVHTLLPGGGNHQQYLRDLDRIATFFLELDPIPIIFRPYHEHNGDWFWWGKGYASEDDFIQLWRLTVEYLRDEKQVHNLIYAFSPDRSRMTGNVESAYFYGYPGDDYVDIFGLDNYWDVGHKGNKAVAGKQAESFRESLEAIVRLADKHDKISALTETGSDGLKNPDWYTSTLLAGVNANDITRRIAYAQVWRNANRQVEGKDHFYVPYAGHPAAGDFIAFKDSKLILFEDELPNMYEMPKYSIGKDGICWGVAYRPPANALQSKDLPKISVRGNKFVDPAGKVVVFRGLAFADPDQLESNGHWDFRLFEEAANIGATLIRVPVHPAAWRRRGPDAYLALLDQAVKWATELGIYLIIDWHSIGNLKVELFQHPMYHTTHAETNQFWQTISSYYKGHNTIAFYEIFNEPTMYRGQLGKVTWSEWKKICEDLIGVIRAHDGETIPLVAGFDWAFDLSFLRYDPIDAEGIGYAVHPYPWKRPEEPWEARWDEIFGFAAAQYPLLATEIGYIHDDSIPVDEQHYGNRITRYLEERNIGWLVWVLDPVWFPKMLEDWDYNLSPMGEFFKEAMHRPLPHEKN